MEEGVRHCWAWIEFLEWAVRHIREIDHAMQVDSIFCPLCGRDIVYLDDEEIHYCDDCGRRFLVLPDVCHSCRAMGVIYYIEERDEYVCANCGANRFVFDILELGVAKSQK